MELLPLLRGQVAVHDITIGRHQEHAAKSITLHQATFGQSKQGAKRLPLAPDIPGGSRAIHGQIDRNTALLLAQALENAAQQ